MDKRQNSVDFWKPSLWISGRVPVFLVGHQV
jgi:hypothetical protein